MACLARRSLLRPSIYQSVPRTTPPITSRRARSMATAESVKSNCKKLVCIGRNYADHIAELNNARPNRPFYFLKPPSSILLPDSGPIEIPPGVVVHHEVELGLVIGKPLRDMPSSDEKAAMDAISHYILAIDLTARNVQDVAKRKGLPWTAGKGFDTFCPISKPWEASRLPDPYKARLWLEVEGEGKRRQDDLAELMLFRIPRLLSEISAVMTLEVGDVVLTGTPKGVGPLSAGMKVKMGCEVDGKDVEEASVGFDVVERRGLYVFDES